MQEAERQERFNESFIHDLINRYACVLGPQADSAQKTKVSGNQLARDQKVTRDPSDIVNRAALAGQRPRVRETHKSTLETFWSNWGNPRR